MGWGRPQALSSATPKVPRTPVSHSHPPDNTEGAAGAPASQMERLRADTEERTPTRPRPSRGQQPARADPHPSARLFLSQERRLPPRTPECTLRRWARLPLSSAFVPAPGLSLGQTQRLPEAAASKPLSLLPAGELPHPKRGSAQSRKQACLEQRRSQRGATCAVSRLLAPGFTGLGASRATRAPAQRGCLCPGC